MKKEQLLNGVSEETRGSGTGGSTNDIAYVPEVPRLFKSLGFADNNKCTKQRAVEINLKLAKFFHNNALPFNLVESEEFADFVKELCPAYYQQGIPGRFWLETTDIYLVYKEVLEEVEPHLENCDALMANMDGWENEKKQQLKIISITGKRISTFPARFICLMF